MGRSDGTFHVNGEEVAPDVRVLTVMRSRAAPFLRVSVTGPAAPAHPMEKGVPTVIT